MGERKVLVNYIPPDFDPSIIPRTKRDKNKLVEVRTMLPFSMRCLTCGEYMYRGKKFNSKKEDSGETYLGIRILRFYIKCSFCSAEIAFKTDPKNADYTMESGATRNFELWRENETVEAEVSTAREEEEKVDAMKALENRTVDSRLEMDVLDALDEIKAINQRHERVNTDALLSLHAVKNQGVSRVAMTQEEEDAIMNNVKFKSSTVRRDDSDEEVAAPTMRDDGIAAKVRQQLSSQRPVASVLDSVVVVRKKRKMDEPVPVVVQKAPEMTSGLAGLMAYGSSDDE